MRKISRLSVKVFLAAFWKLYSMFAFAAEYSETKSFFWKFFSKSVSIFDFVQKFCDTFLRRKSIKRVKTVFYFSGGNFRENNCLCSKQFSFFFSKFLRKVIGRFAKLHWTFSEERLLEEKHLFANLFFNPYCRSSSQTCLNLANIFRSFFKLAFLSAEEQLEDGFSFWRFHRFLIFLVVLPVIFRIFGENIIAACSVVHVLFSASIWNLWVVFLENLKHFVHNFGTWAVFFWTFGGKVSPVFLKLPSACPEERREDFFKKF